jgi:hypothetical protein
MPGVILCESQDDDLFGCDEPSVALVVFDPDFWADCEPVAVCDWHAEVAAGTFARYRTVHLVPLSDDDD